MQNRPHPVTPTATYPEFDRDFVTQMSARPRPSKLVDWPGDSPLPGYEQIRIIIPAEVEYSKARLAAHKRMSEESKLPVDEWNTPEMAGIVGDLIAKEMLARCCYRDRETENGTRHQRLFGDSKHVEQALMKDEIAILFDLFICAEHELGPRLAVLSEDELDMWIERLKRGLDPLARMALPSLVELIRGLLLRVERLSGFLSQESQFSSSLSTSDSPDPGSSVTDSVFSGEPPVE
jgi:hypothetical protein